jgi:zinc/manganese transport system substrate-binding protein
MAVQKAQLVIYTGIGYDTWMQHIIGASSGSRDVINVGADLLGKQTGDNPHVWYLPTTMPALADKIADDLSALDPSDAGYFHKRAKAYDQTIQPIDRLVAQLKQPTPVPVDVSEPVFDYMLHAMNMVPEDPKFALAIENGNEPTPTEVAQLQHDITTHRIRFFVENIQTDDPTVRNLAQLAKQHQIPVVQVTETEPKGEDYVTWMTRELQEVKSALDTQPASR